MVFPGIIGIISRGGGFSAVLLYGGIMGVDGRKAALSRLFFSFSLSLDRKCKFPVFKCNSGSNFKKKKKWIFSFLKIKY